MRNGSTNWRNKKKKGAPCLSMRHEPRSGKERREGVNFEWHWRFRPLCEVGHFQCWTQLAFTTSSRSHRKNLFLCKNDQKSHGTCPRFYPKNCYWLSRFEWVTGEEKNEVHWLHSIRLALSTKWMYFLVYEDRLEYLPIMGFSPLIFK